MAYKITFLILAIVAFASFNVNAQQSSTPHEVDLSKIGQLRQDMYGVDQQLTPMRSQLQQLMEQVKEIRQKMVPLEDRLMADRQQIQVLISQGHPNH